MEGAEEPKYNKTEQIQEYEEKPGNNKNNDERFCENLLIRLINNKIAITDHRSQITDLDEYLGEWVYAGILYFV